MEMFKTLLFTLLIISICVALLAVKVIIKKNGRFPNTHVGGNKEMRRRGIKCVQSQDKDARRDNPMAVKESIKYKSKKQTAYLQTMKTTKKITLAVTLIVAQLFFVQCSPKADNAGNADNSSFNINTVIEGTDTMRTVKIAYVDYDSLLAKFNYAQEVQKEIIKKEMSINNTIEQERQSLQEEAMEFERKMQNNIYLTQERAQAEYEKIMKKDQELMKRGQAMIAELEKTSNEKYKMLTDCINEHIKEYNKTRGFDFILTRMGGNMLYANEALDITNEIAKGLNAKYSKQQN